MISWLQRFAGNGPSAWISKKKTRNFMRWRSRTGFFAREKGTRLPGRVKRMARAFFQFWTAKEAVLKATALGLSLELSKLEIGLSPLRILAMEDAGKIHRQAGI